MSWHLPEASDKPPKVAVRRGNWSQSRDTGNLAAITPILLAYARTREPGSIRGKTLSLALARTATADSLACAATNRGHPSQVSDA